MHRRCIPPVGKSDHPFEAEQYLARCPLHRGDHPWGPRASSAEALDLHHCMLESTRPEDLVRTEQFFSVTSSQLVDSLSSSFSLKPNDAATTSKLRRPPPRDLPDSADIFHPRHDGQIGRPPRPSAVDCREAVGGRGMLTAQRPRAMVACKGGCVCVCVHAIWVQVPSSGRCVILLLGKVPRLGSS